MKISIVVNNFNYAPYVGAAIDSALNQSHAETEVIVVDDGSTDASDEILRPYEDRITAIFQDNKGQGVALSNGFTHCTGDIVLFLDADDLLEPNAAAVAVAEFKADEKLARVQWPMRVIDANGDIVGPITPRPEMMASGDLSQHILRFRTHVWPATSGSAYRATILKQLLPAPANFRWGTDLYLAETTALLGTVKSISDPLGRYRVHGANNWARSRGDVSHIRQNMAWTINNHVNVKRIAGELGLHVPDSATDALDVAFIQQRLASLRMDPTGHPISTDRRIPLMIRGFKAALLHPHHTKSHKLKRVGWIAVVALAPRGPAKKAIERFYFRPAK